MNLLPVPDALAAMRRALKPIGEHERVALDSADGRVLARSVLAERDQPPFPASAMDGYAVRAADLPGRLRCVGEAAAGRPFEGRIISGECCRIFTGAVVPEGADSVLIQENAVADGGFVTADEPLAPGRFVRPAALDYAAGDTLVAAGERLDPVRLSLCAAAGLPEIDAVRRPRVGVLMSGDELARPGDVLPPAGIHASNGYGVAAMARRFGADAFDLGIAADSMESLAEALASADEGEADIVVTLGGASVGDHDLVAPALRAHGVELEFMKLAMRPGKPVMFGTRGRTAYLGLPGNPVSSLVGARVLLVALIERLLGMAESDSHTTAVLAVDLPANGDRRHYMRARTGPDGVRPFENQDSSLLATLARADALLVREPNEPPRRAGKVVPVIRL